MNAPASEPVPPPITQPVIAASMAPAARHGLAILAVIAGIGAFSAMDAAMKGASLVVGVYSALLLRNALATLFALPIWALSGPVRPTRERLRLHAIRAAVTTSMASLFFYGLVRIPMAEAIAISFISPIIALFLAALMLGEVVRPRAILASLFGLVGVAVIGSGRFGTLDTSPETVKGIAAVLLSAVFYAVNLVLQRKQAQMTRPGEITLFQNLFCTLYVALPAPLLFVLPHGIEWGLVALAAASAALAHLLLSWGYARAETQVLVPIEYTAFPWAALLGWLIFQENVAIATLAGTVLIVAGCWVGTRNKISPAET
ncbi:DMT family transporter [Novosphingobium profundi]|uniref:DMT family transporter n=1 Tax=Novosphingobium profundi TaxID=1774954 RepID=UPI001BD99AA8|nr:DMT family transporter [Novosphingobium profundi]MBT0667838.1 DMT family transporter [Novosphingobium profundi]